ncbi:hypothetical protein COPEUT_01684 [Coprococcus eutactus ATCC 27759]|nr:hypothetical protein COPEUT_01684 [Coprococcus eutactus ATCC 27759]
MCLSIMHTQMSADLCSYTIIYVWSNKKIPAELLLLA